MRHFPWFVIALCCPVLSAHAQRDAASASRDTIVATPSMINRDLAPLDSLRHVMLGALRADSGTRRADSIFLHAAIGLRDVYRSNHSFGRLLERIGLAPDQSMYGPERRAFAEHGLWVSVDEGLADLDLSQRSLRDSAGSYLTESMRGLLALRITEQEHPTGGDAAIGIPLDELERRIDSADALVRGNPDFAASDEAKYLQAWYVWTYLAGWDNTPVFDRHGAIRPGFRARFEKFAASHRQTASGAIARKYVELLRSTGWRNTPGVRRFLASLLARVDALSPARTGGDTI